MRLATFDPKAEKFHPPLPTKKAIAELKPGDIVRLGKGEHGIAYFEVIIAKHSIGTRHDFLSVSGIEFQPEHIREIVETILDGGGD